MAIEPDSKLESSSGAIASRSAVDCQIQSSSKWSRWSSGELWSEVRTALDRSIAPWLNALELPVDVRFSWQADRGTDWPGDGICRLLFDDRDSVFVRLPEEASAKAGEVASLLANGVFEARTSLVTADVVQHLRPDAGAAADGASERVRLARELVRRGLRPRRAWNAELGLTLPPSGSPYDTIIDQEAIALRVKLSDLALLNAEARIHDPFDKLLDRMSDGMFYELGIMMPPVEIEEDPALAPAAIAIWVNEMPLPPVTGLAAGELLINETAERLKLFGIDKARPAINPANGNQASIVAATDENISAVKGMGLTSWGPAGYLVLVLSAAVRHYAGALWTVDSTKAVLFLLRDATEPLIRATNSQFDHSLLTLVLRGLLDEEISVRNMSAILEAMLAIDSVSIVDNSKLIAFPPAAGNVAVSRQAASVADLQVNDWVTCARIWLFRYLSHKYIRGQASLIVYLLDPAIEAELEAASGMSPGVAGQEPMLHTPQGYLRLFRAIDAEIATHDLKAVILTPQNMRHTLRELISKDFPNVTVLCYQELAPEMNIQPIARIAWP